jgi:hypothetical protein
VYYQKYMVGRVGFEPTTNWLKANCSTTELTTQKNGRGRGIRTPDILLPKQARYRTALYPDGSTTWTRTRDPMINSHLLYRLSYRGTLQTRVNSLEVCLICGATFYAIF